MATVLERSRAQVCGDFVLQACLRSFERHCKDQSGVNLLARCELWWFDLFTAATQAVPESQNMSAT